MLITDIEMPGQSGFELADALSAERPELPILFMSGVDRGDLRIQQRLGRHRAFLEKPFSPDALLAEILELAAPPLHRLARAAG